MVALFGNEYWVVRLSQENTFPPRIATLGRHPSDLQTFWFSGPVTHNAAITFFMNLTVNIITYTWDIEMMQCVFGVKRVRLPSHLAPTPDRLSVASLDMFNDQLVIIAGEVCNILTTI
jgi:hypothetical protein